MVRVNGIVYTCMMHEECITDMCVVLRRNVRYIIISAVRFRRVFIALLSTIDTSSERRSAVVVCV